MTTIICQSGAQQVILRPMTVLHAAHEITALPAAPTRQWESDVRC